MGHFLVLPSFLLCLIHSQLIRLKKGTHFVFGDLKLTEQEKDIIRKSPGYIKLKNEEGSGFADAVYFGIDK